MSESPTLAEALRADEERFAVARETLLAEYRHLLYKRPDVPLPFGGPGAFESTLGVCPQMAESWRETLEGEDVVLLGQIAERLGFDERTVRRHAIAVSRYRRARRKIAALGDLDKRLRETEAAQKAAGQALLEAVEAEIRTSEAHGNALMKQGISFAHEGTLQLLRQEFGEILPAD